MSQSLNHRFYRLSNTFKRIVFLGNQLLSLNSYVGISETPQSLEVNPGQFETLINDGKSYGMVFQDLTVKTLKTNNSIGFTKGWRSFSFSPQLGMKLKKEQLLSNISTVESQTLPDVFRNNLDWIHSKLYFDLKTQYDADKWNIELKTPVNFNSYKIKDESLQKNEEIKRLTFEPRLSVNYTLNANWNIGTTASLSNRFGKINQLHYAYILNSYRTIQRIDAPLPQIFNQRITGRISYRAPLQSIFWSVFYSQTFSENNLLYQAQLLENGAKTLQAILQNNDRENRSILTRFSKYVEKLNTNMKLDASFETQKFQQILNDNITAIENRNWSFGSTLDTEFTKGAFQNFAPV